MRRHPLRRDRLRAFLARTRFSTLLLLLALAYVTLGAVLGALLAVLPAAHPPRLLEAFRTAESFLLFQGGSLPTGPQASSSEEIVDYLAGFTSVVLPGVFLGSIIFKLTLSPSVFVLRNRLAIMQAPDDHDLLSAGSSYVALRFYSATSLAITDLTCRVITQNWRYHDGDRVLRVRELALANPRFPQAIPQTPYTVQIPLVPGDVSRGSSSALRSIQGHALGPHDELIVLLSGSIPSLGNDFSEAHRLRTLDVLSHERFGSVSVDFAQSPRRWKGWKQFDE